MFIYVLKLLLETDQTAATIVFATLNTTRARLDLVERLGKARIADKTVMKELERIIQKFSDSTRIRNEFNHCMYSVNERGDITHTYSMRIQEVRGRLQLGATKKMDNARIQQMIKTVQDLRQLNRDLWNFVERLQTYMVESKATTEPTQK